MAERDPALLYYETDVALDVSLMDRLARGCYFDLIQQYRRFRGFTAVQLRNILGNDYDKCWNALELVLEYDEKEEKYHIRWLKVAVAKRAKGNETQRERIQKYWDQVKEEERKALAEGRTVEKPRKRKGNTKDIPRNSPGTTMDIPIENENENENEKKDRKEDDVGGVEGEEGEREGFSDWKPPEGEALPTFPNILQTRMYQLFLAEFSDYPRKENIDLASCQRIGYEIGDLNGWPWEACLNGRREAVLAEWREIVAFIKTSKWYRTKPLSFLSDNLQGLIQAKNDARKQSPGSADVGKFTATGSPVVQTFVGAAPRKPWRS